MKVHYSDVQFHELPFFTQDIINEILRREGGVYTDHPNDYPTKWGIRKLSADRAGWEGKISDLTKTEAAQIWTSLFWFGPNLHLLSEVSTEIANTVIDTGGPAGIRIGITHLQEALTSFNMLEDGQRIFGPDLERDGILGQKSFDQLGRYLEHRGGYNGETKLAVRLNCLQDAHYTKLAVNSLKHRDFSFGWLSGRVYDDLVALANETDEMVFA